MTLSDFTEDDIVDITDSDAIAARGIEYCRSHLEVYCAVATEPLDSEGIINIISSQEI